MKPMIRWTAFLSFALLLARTLGAVPVAFVGIHVVPMDAERILKNKTVLVEDGVISRIDDPSKIKLPAGTLQIDARGLYLMPGLADMHVHLSTPTDLLLYITQGVTTIRNMRGSPTSLALRDQVLHGKIQGPSIYTAGPILDGTPPSGENVVVVETAAEAEAAVRAQKKAGYDFVKVYSRLSTEAYHAILTTAKELGMSVAGHTPSAIGLEGTLEARQSSIEHLTGYMRALSQDKKNAENHKQVDQTKIPEWAKATARAGVYNCVTLVVQQNFAAASDYQKFLKRPEIRYVAPLRLAMWNPSRNIRFRSMSEDDYEAAKRGIEVLLKLTKAIKKAGAPILVGTDSPSRFVVPGFAIHQELQNLVTAGLSPFEALRAGTYNAAAFFQRTDKFGTVSVGKRADLLLIRGNPLQDIANVAHIEGVMVRGNWLPKNKLQDMLSQVVASYQPVTDRFQDLPDWPGQSEFFGRYDILLSGVIAGQERVAIYRDSDGVQIVSQQSLDPPFQATGILKISIDERGLPTAMHAQIQRVEGKSDIKAIFSDSELQIEGQLPYQEPVRLKGQRNPSHLFTASMIASRFLLWNHLKQLQLGEKSSIPMQELDFSTILNKGFQITESELKVVRKPDQTKTLGTTSITVRVFEAEVKTKYDRSSVEFQFDKEGRLFSYITEAREFRRTE